MKSPEMELANESVYIPKDLKSSPFQDKENVLLNFNQKVRPIPIITP